MCCFGLCQFKDVGIRAEPAKSTGGTAVAFARCKRRRNTPAPPMPGLPTFSRTKSMNFTTERSDTILDTAAREALLSQHLGLVYHVARQLCRSKGMDVELDELVSAGTLGLIEAFNNFDAARGLAFSTFAAPRIRGAMLDELRRQDHVPRSVRRRSRELNAATEKLTRELGHTPDRSQVAGSSASTLTPSGGGRARATGRVSFRSTSPRSRPPDRPEFPSSTSSPRRPWTSTIGSRWGKRSKSCATN